MQVYIVSWRSFLKFSKKPGHDSAATWGAILSHSAKCHFGCWFTDNLHFHIGSVWLPNNTSCIKPFCVVQKLMWGGAVWSIEANYLTQDQILLRCYLLGRQGPCRLWGYGLASRSSMVLGPGGTNARRSAGCAALLTCLVQLPVRGVAGSVWWLIWGERRELVQNWFVFKIMTVWARPANKIALGKNLSLLEDREKFPSAAVSWWECEMSWGVLLSSWLICARAQYFCECECWLVAKPNYFILNLLISI